METNTKTNTKTQDDSMSKDNMENRDYVVRATAADAQIRAFAATTRNLVETARQNHNTSPVVTAALGRLLTAGSMMGIMMKGEDDLLTLAINGTGPVKGLIVSTDSKGGVKGYAKVPDAMLPPNAQGKLDVGGIIGPGTLQIIRDMGLKDPYVGTIELQSGEIAEDLTYYFATSEQIPSSVGLGVLMDKNNTVDRAGGFIIQLMPFASDETLSTLEENLKSLGSVTGMLKSGMSPEDILKLLLKDLDPEINETTDTFFQCNCSTERIERALISLGKKDLNEMIEDGKNIEIKCQFCNKAYEFTPEQLKKLLAQARS